MFIPLHSNISAHNPQLLLVMDIRRMEISRHWDCAMHFRLNPNIQANIKEEQISQSLTIAPPPSVDAYLTLN